MRIFPLVLAASAIALVACSDGAQPVSESGSTVTWQPHPGVDTSTTPGFPSAVTIQGSVYQAGTGVPTDTGAVSMAPPVPGVTVRIMHNVLRNGQASQDEMARAGTGAGGVTTGKREAGGGRRGSVGARTCSPSARGRTGSLSPLRGPRASAAPP